MSSLITAPVSAIIPCYRCAQTIERAVESVVAQSFRPVELILVDDYSGDATLDVLNKLKNKYGDWLKVVSLKMNVGAASARNAGWSVATQPYIAFLDSDDAWHVNKIEIQYGYMQNNPDVVLSGHLFRELSGVNVNGLNWSAKLRSVQKIFWVQLLLKNQFVTPSVMVKRDVEFHFYEGKCHMEDHLLWLEIVGANYLVVKLNIELAAVFKPMYGASGLSSNILQMERAELLNYRYLYHQNKLKFYEYAFLQCFSVAKFFKRLLIVYVIRHLKVW